MGQGDKLHKDCRRWSAKKERKRRKENKKEGYMRWKRQSHVWVSPQDNKETWELSFEGSTQANDVYSSPVSGVNAIILRYDPS